MVSESGATLATWREEVSAQLKCVRAEPFFFRDAALLQAILSSVLENIDRLASGRDPISSPECSSNPFHGLTKRWSDSHREPV